MTCLCLARVPSGDVRLWGVGAAVGAACARSCHICFDPAVNLQHNVEHCWPASNLLCRFKLKGNHTRKLKQSEA